MKKTQYVVLLILINKHNHILISKRQKHQTFADHWEFPGGKLEANESSKSALFRESLEEINYKPEKASHFFTIKYEYEKFWVQLESWICFDQLPEIKANEGQKLYWATLSELESLKFPKANKVIISELKSLLNSRSH